MTILRTAAGRYLPLWAVLAGLAAVLVGAAVTEAATSTTAGPGDTVLVTGQGDDPDADRVLGGGDDDPDEDDDDDERDGTTGDGTGEPTRTNDQAADAQAQQPAPTASTSAAAESSAPVSGPSADTVRPTLASVRPFLARRSRPHRLRLFATEDVMLEVTVVAVGRSRDLIRKRSFRVFARQGRSTVRLPNMNLSAKRYRLRIAAIDRSGNRSAVQAVVARLR